MKRLVYAAKRYADKPMDMLYSAIGISKYYGDTSIYEANEGKWNFRATKRYDRADKDQELIAGLKKAGAKYITPRHGDVYFYIDMSQFQNKHKELQDEYDRQYGEELDAMDIDQYRPDAATLNKLSNYRAKGSKVNVNAIKDNNKVLTYFYGAKLLGWNELAHQCRSKLSWSYDEVLDAITRRVQADDSYSDKRSSDDIALEIPDSKGLFEFETRTNSGKPSCWLPKELLKLFISDDVPVYFGKRTSGGQYDRNGAEWSEVEHIVVDPDGDNTPFDIVVHTNERADGSIPNRYTVIADGRCVLDRASRRDLIDYFSNVL